MPEWLDSPDSRGVTYHVAQSGCRVTACSVGGGWITVSDQAPCPHRRATTTAVLSWAKNLWATRLQLLRDYFWECMSSTTAWHDWKQKKWLQRISVHPEEPPRANLVAQSVKNLSALWETQVPCLGWKIPWRREWLPTPVFLPGESSWREEPGGEQSMGLHRVRHDWATKQNAAQRH